MGSRPTRCGERRSAWVVGRQFQRRTLAAAVPKQGSWPADAQAFLPYPWEPASVNPVIQLVNVIYPRVMSGEVTLKPLLGMLSAPAAKADEVVTPWPGIVSAFKDHKLTLGNRIAPKTFKASYERYLSVALVPTGRKAARQARS